MNQPSNEVMKEFKKISKSIAAETSLNWCEKRKAWGVLAYEYNIGSYWVSFMIFDRRRK